MSGYVEAGYAVVGVTLTSYTLWLLLRSRSVARTVTARDGKPGDAAKEEPGWR